MLSLIKIVGDYNCSFVCTEHNFTLMKVINLAQMPLLLFVASKVNDLFEL